MPLLIVGLPRSGTTWVGETLGRTQGATYIHEPDNDMVLPFAMYGKRDLGMLPVLSEQDDAPSYQVLWERALRGQTRNRSPRYRIAARLFWSADRAEREVALASSPSRLTVRLRLAGVLSSAPFGMGPTPIELAIAKTALAPFCVEWIAHRFQTQVLVVVRDPLNTLASWIEVGLRERMIPLEDLPRVRERLLLPFGIEAPRIDPSPLVRAAWNYGLESFALQRSLNRHPRWRTVSHDRLIENPQEGFKELCERLELEWATTVSDFLRASERPGSGFDTGRLVSELPERWRRVFSSQDVRQIRDVLERFPSTSGA